MELFIGLSLVTMGDYRLCKEKWTRTIVRVHNDHKVTTNRC
jgi:hypothetical protein